MVKYKVVVYYPPKKKFVTLEKNVSMKRAMRLAYYFKGRELSAKIKKVV
jgi:hypothetical protein